MATWQQAKTHPCSAGEHPTAAPRPRRVPPELRNRPMHWCSRSSGRLAQALGESWPSGSVELTPQICLRDSELESLMRALQAELEVGVHFGSLFAETVAQGLAVYLAQRYAAFPPRLAPFPACGWYVTHGISPQSLNKSEEPNNCPKNGTCCATVRASILEPRRNAVVALLKTRTEPS